MKQTAIDWIHSKILLRIGLDDNDIIDLRNIVEEAKEMEKEQIEDAYWLGTYDYDMSYPAQQYYKDTYEKD